MTTIRTILAATDFSPGSTAAVARAVQLAAMHRASLCLLHAFDASAWHKSEPAFDAQHPADALPPEMRMQQRVTDSAASLAERTGLEVEAHFGLGAPAKVIDAYAQAHASSLVVAGSRADPTTPGLGSTAFKLVRLPRCPVLVVRAAATRRHDRVLSAVDMLEGSVRAASFAVTLFPAAHHHLLYALDPAAGSPPWRAGQSTEQLQRHHRSLHAQAERELLQLAQQLSARVGDPVVAEIADDVPARAILVGAANLPADCVVVGHHGHGPATDISIGSMAQHVIHAAISDVLVVP